MSSCGLALLVVCGPLGSMKENGLLHFAMFKRGSRGDEVAYHMQACVLDDIAEPVHGSRCDSHTSRANPCLTAWSRYTQDETGLVRNEGRDMGEMLYPDKGMRGLRRRGARNHTRRTERDVKRREGGGGEAAGGGGGGGGGSESRGGLGSKEYHCKVTVGMGSLTTSESRANGC